MKKFAEISADGLYRYSLFRRWGSSKFCTFIMLNPSTADAEIDDPTIRRCINFAKRENCEALLVVNLFAFRATNPQMLRLAIDPVGERNDTIVGLAILYSEGPVICAWGSHPDAQERGNNFIRKYEGERIFYCLGITKSGAPRHPLYVRNDQPLIEYKGTM